VAAQWPGRTQHSRSHSAEAERCGACPQGWGEQEPLEPDAWLHALADLAAGAPLTGGARPAAGAAAADAAAAQRHPAPDPDPGRPPQPWGAAAGAAEAVARLPPEVLARVRGTPGLQNLARALAYQRRVADEVAVTPAAIDAAAAAAADLADTLRILLCI